MTIWSQGPTTSKEWEMSYVDLPAGYFKIEIEAAPTGLYISGSTTETINIAIDDVYIGRCPQVEECKRSQFGTGYRGTRDLAANNQKCIPWSEVPSYLPPSWFHQYTSIQQDLMEKSNYCRNPDSDDRGPWCFTDEYGLGMAYCDVPFCSCNSTSEYTCSDGRCISIARKCDSVPDCADASDETGCPNINMNCTFNGKQSCLYENSKSNVNAIWVVLDNQVRVDLGQGGRAGEISEFISPKVFLPASACLRIELKLTPDANLDLGLKYELDSLLTQHQCHVGALVNEMTNDTDTNPSWEIIQTEFGLSGNFHVVFTASLPSESSSVALRNVTLFPAGCPIDKDSDSNNSSYNYDIEYDFDTSTMSDVMSLQYENTIYDSIVNEDGNQVFIDLCNSTETCTTCLQPLIDSSPNITEHGISCNFNPDTDCGYKTLSSNTNWKWIIKEDNASNSVTPGDWFLTPESTETPLDSEWNRLYSPQLLPTGTSCLQFEYRTRNADIYLYIYTDYSTELIFYLPYDGTLDVWHQQLVPVPAASLEMETMMETSTQSRNNLTLSQRQTNENATDEMIGGRGIVFELVYNDAGFESIGIRNVVLTEGECRKHEQASKYNVTCDFTEYDWCGYQDISEGMPQWYVAEYPPIVIKTRDNTGLGKNVAKLLSPPVDLNNAHCLKFVFYAQGIQGAYNDIATISILQVNQSDHTQVLSKLWAVYNIIKHVYLDGQVTLDPGQYRLLFEVSGDEYQAGFAEKIELIEGQCTNITCADDEIVCNISMACISKSLVCDGVAQCDGGEDELNCQDNAEETSTSDGNADVQFSIGDGGIVSESYRHLQVEHLNITTLHDLYWMTGHQAQDFIYGCHFAGQLCSHEDFSRIITDYGLCYSFNAHREGLQIERTGVSMGLRLVLNLEQYDYMVGPSSDAGINMYLHDPGDPAQMKDLGFSSAPGLHTLVGITRNDAINLPPSYGDCGETTLNYYDSYRFSRCLVDCQTEYLVSRCGCRDSFMPTLNKSLPPLECSLDQFFNCAVPLSGDMDPPEKVPCSHSCPPPCKQIAYDPTISFSSLSDLTVDDLLESGLLSVTGKYNNALETRARTDGLIFTEDLKNLANLVTSYENQNVLLGEYVNDADGSVPNILKGMEGYMDILTTDIKSVWNMAKEFKTVYDEMYNDYVMLILDYTDSITRINLELGHVLKSYAITGKVHFEKDSVVADGRKLLTFQQEILHTIVEDMKNKTEQDKSSGVPLMLPRVFFQPDQLCYEKIDMFNESSLRLDNLYTLVSLWTDGQDEALYYNQALEDFTETSKGYLDTSSQLSQCLLQYPNRLESAFSTYSRLETEVTDNMDSSVNFDYNVNIAIEVLNADLNRVKAQFTSYILAETSKAEMLEIILQENEDSRIENTVEVFSNSIRNHIQIPLQSLVTAIKTSTKQAYLDIIQELELLTYFLHESEVVEMISSLVIWQQPIFNLYEPEKYSDTGRLFWQIYDESTSITEFIQGDAVMYIDEAVESYFQPMIDEIEKFEGQMTKFENDLIFALKNIRTTYDDYKSLKTINSKFVLNNFLKIDVHYKQLKVSTVEQQKGYTIVSFFGELGGYVGLLLGGSVISLIEIIDFFTYHCFRKRYIKRATKNNDIKAHENGAFDLKL